MDETLDGATHESKEILEGRYRGFVSRIWESLSLGSLDADHLGSSK